MSSDGPTITSLELEDRRFPPPPEFADQANATEELYDRAAGDPEAFWLAQTKELLAWETEPTQGEPLEPSNTFGLAWRLSFSYVLLTWLVGVGTATLRLAV